MCIYLSLSIYIYIYIYMLFRRAVPSARLKPGGCSAAPLSARPALEYGVRARSCTTENQDTTNLRTKILNFRGFDSSRVLVLRGWTSHARGEFPGKFESSKLSRDNLVGRSGVRHMEARSGEPDFG